MTSLCSSSSPSRWGVLLLFGPTFIDFKVQRLSRLFCSPVGPKDRALHCSSSRFDPDALVKLFAPV
jgi:hypothetical protein